MENKHHQNLSLIIESISKQADNEQKTLEDASEKLYKEKYEALEKEIKAEYRKKTDYELSRLTLEANKKASELEADQKAKLSALRDKICDEVYHSVKERIHHFTDGEKYEGFLADSAKKISALYDGSVVIYIRSADLCHRDIIAKAFVGNVSFKEDQVIKLGGIKVLFEEHSVLVDDTLDSRLEGSKKDFIKNSDLGREV